MKTKQCLLALMLAATAVAGAEMRTWTFEKSGKTLEAEAAGFTDNAVTLKEADGKTVSVPIAYLSKNDQAYLASAQAGQWKEVEVVKLDASTAVGRYKKCTARGAGVDGDIYIERLPASVVSVLQTRNQQAAPIDELSKEIEARKHGVQDDKAALPDKGPKSRAQRRAAKAQRAQVNVETSDLNGLQVNLDKLQKEYDASVAKTKSQTVVRMRNTGVVYKSLPLWQCFDPQKQQQ
jgi:SLA1 homology domain 1, SHD1